MSLKPIDATCENCGKRWEWEPQRSAAGFQKMQCPDCLSSRLYPLPSGTRSFYWIVVICFGIGAAFSMASGRLPLPGLVAAVAIGSLVKDSIIRHHLAAEERDRLLR
jgi:hypothetical protein